MAQSSLISLPVEVLHNILAFLDIPSLIQTSRTCQLLRYISSDPAVQRARLSYVRHDLNLLLEGRVSKASICPPNAWIWLSKTNVLSRSISRSLIRIRLSYSIDRRPCVEDLIDRAILPECCSRKRTSPISPAIISQQEAIRKSRLKHRLGKLLERRPTIAQVVEKNIMPAECFCGSKISPKLVETRRKVIRENIKTGLKAWVKRRGIEEQKRKEEEHNSCIDGISVQAVVRKFSARMTAMDLQERIDRLSLEKRHAQARWGRELANEKLREERRAEDFGTCSQPTRAHVLSLKRFWESVIVNAVS